MTDTAHAIQAILHGDWEKAIQLNLAILEENNQDIETLNRLAFAYTALGKIANARGIYQKVLDIDPCNPIALKNIKKLGDSNSRKNEYTPFTINNTMFLEEVGKTKVITLVNTAPPRVLRTLQPGLPLILHIKRMKIFVLDEKQQFLGMLPDNSSKRLIKFIKGGNKYTTYIKSVENRIVTIFMREVKRSAKFKNQPSFVITDASQQTLILPNKRKNNETNHHDISEE